MRLVTVVIAITAVAAIAWLVLEARALRSPAPAPSAKPAAPSAPPIATTTPPPSPSPSPAPPSRPAAHTRTLAPPNEPVVAPPEPKQPPPPSGPVAPAETAAALDRVESVLSALTRACPLPRGADRSQHLVVRVSTTRDRVESIEHREGALPDSVVTCVDKRLRAARWPAIAAPLTLELDVRAADLQ